MALKIEGDLNTGATRYQIDHAGTFELPPLSGSDSTKLPIVMFHAAAQHLADTADAISSIDADPTLSALGKAQKLAPLRAELIEKVALTDANVDVEERHWSAQEKELLQVPGIDSSNTVAAVEDREIRDWWRGQSPEARHALMGKMKAEPGNERLMIAMLRSPIPQLDHEVSFMRDLWNQLARLNDPGKAASIEVGRAQVEWARRGIATVAAFAGRVVKMDERALAETLLASQVETVHGKHGLFGVDHQTMDNIKRAKR
jgi:hypothetical protein